MSDNNITNEMGRALIERWKEIYPGAGWQTNHANTIYFHSRSNHIRSSTGMGEDTHMIWNGIDVDVWGPIQTRNPPRDRTAMKITWYDGFDCLRIDADMVERIPLDIRYQSFTKRLDKALRREL